MPDTTVEPTSGKAGQDADPPGLVDIRFTELVGELKDIDSAADQVRLLLCAAVQAQVFHPLTRRQHALCKRKLQLQFETQCTAQS